MAKDTVLVTKLAASNASKRTVEVSVGTAWEPFNATDVDKSRGQLSDSEAGGRELPLVTLGRRFVNETIDNKNLVTYQL